ncbi:MAG: SMP-30/gluconolactonase/LRE family protein, partial [Planctomycetaceae bacterium]|nr:SMP-30/gluconolactonase/LRE family protein [Planctomycetaceae bacterium]
MILNRLVLCSLAILACQGIALATEWDEILPAGNSVSKLAEGFKFTEGPAWHPDGFLLFTDIPNDRIMKWDGSQISEFATPVGRCNGLMADQRGTIYACQMGDGHVITFNSEGRQTGALVDTFDGNRLNGPNDLTIDQQGGMYFTDPYYGPDKELPQPMMAVYYVDPEGNTTRIIE